MNSVLIALLVLSAPLAFICTAFISWYQPGLRPKLVKTFGNISSLISIVAAAISGFFIAQNGLQEFGVFGLGIRLDALSMIMFGMIALIGFIVLRFSINYLDGDERQGRFLGRMAFTLAAVQLLVLSGTLGLLLLSWVMASSGLHRLLIFYRERIAAQVAARKKFIIARIGDFFLLTAAALLYQEFGTGNLELIFQGIQNQMAVSAISTQLEIAALCVALAAMFKSAQFPTHGWLPEVMESPTPVSALLHAGLLNAGPFLLIRFAHIFEATTYVSYLVVIIGGFTALFGSVVFLTQTSIKTSLAYSSIAHMGFSLMVSGLGAFPAALLHLVAHSFYKAHAFLSSGSIVEVKRASKVERVLRTGNPLRIALGLILALAVYLGFARIWGMDLENNLPLIAIGAVIVMGLSTLFIAAIDSNGSVKLMLRAAFMAIVVATAFFTLESGMHHILEAGLPAPKMQTVGMKVVVALLLSAFSGVVFIQLLAPKWAEKSQYRALAIHLKNGLYINVLFDRWIGALRIGLASKSFDKEALTEGTSYQEQNGAEDLEYVEELIAK